MTRMSGLAVQTNQMKQYLAKGEKDFAQALAEHGIAPASFMRAAMTAVSQNPKLLECDKRSFAISLMNAAHLGLLPDGARGLAYLIPFGGKVQLIPGYRGLRDLCWRTGQLHFWASEVVYENDAFDYDGLSGQATFRKCETGDRGAVLGYLAAARLNGSPFLMLKFLLPDEAEEHKRKFAMARRSGTIFGPWVDHFDAMALKTAALMLVKTMPMVSQGRASSAVALDENPDLNLDPTKTDWIEAEIVPENENPPDKPPVTSGRVPPEEPQA